MTEHKARKRFGQNFLQDTRIISDIVNAVRPQADDIVIEIGPGLAAITEPLTRKLNQLHVCEIDRDIIQFLKKQPFANKLVIHDGDVLQFDFRSIVGKKKIVGNLPYNISTPLLFRLADVADDVIDMHFMLQKEVVKRLCAAPNSKAYGRLTIMAQYFCQVMPVLEVPPSAFKPAPKVDSAVVRLIPHKELPHPVKDLYWLNRVCSQAFNQRRKTLRNALSTLFSPENLTALGIDLNARAENLAIADYARLANWLADNPPVDVNKDEILNSEE